MKKGFTLVELLGVIVILGVVLVIAVPKITEVINANKEESFFVSAKNLIRELEYLNIDNSSMNYISLNQLDFNKSNTNNYDLNNSYAYIRNNKVYLDLLGINTYKGMRVCAFTSDKKNLTLTNSDCKVVSVLLTINLDGGATNQTFEESYTINSTITLEPPIKEKGTFAGWEITSGNGIISGNNLTFGSEDITIKAKWASPIELIVDLDDGSIAVNPSGNYYSNERINLGTPTKEGYDFAGWIKESGDAILSENIIIMQTTSTAIKATYKKIIELSVDLNGGNIDVTLNPSYHTGDTIDLPIPTKIGNTFAGWSIESGNSTISGNNLTIGTQDTIIKANWTPATYSIAYNCNNGSGTTAKSTHTYGAEKTLTKNACYRIATGAGGTVYYLKGWGTAPDATTVSYTDEQSVINLSTTQDDEITLYAVWDNLFSVTGNYEVIDDKVDGTPSTYGNWKVRIYGAEGQTSGVASIKFNISSSIDAFLVGGGGGGTSSWDELVWNGSRYTYYTHLGGGGGAGYNRTERVSTNAGQIYDLVIGAGGGIAASPSTATTGASTTGFGYTANGGGGARGASNTTGGTQVYEFGGTSGTIYSVNGTRGSTTNENNCGYGGDGASARYGAGTSGTSGVVSIRNAR